MQASLQQHSSPLQGELITPRRLARTCGLSSKAEETGLCPSETSSWCIGTYRTWTTVQLKSLMLCMARPRLSWCLVIYKTDCQHLLQRYKRWWAPRVQCGARPRAPYLARLTCCFDPSFAFALYVIILQLLSSIPGRCRWLQRLDLLCQLAVLACLLYHRMGESRRTFTGQHTTRASF